LNGLGNSNRAQHRQRAIVAAGGARLQFGSIVAHRFDTNGWNRCYLAIRAWPGERPLTNLLRRSRWRWRTTGMVMNGHRDFRSPFSVGPLARRHGCDLASLVNSVCMLTRTIRMSAISEENG
jgi:hypothetical protein